MQYFASLIVSRWQQLAPLSSGRWSCYSEQARRLESVKEEAPEQRRGIQDGLRANGVGGLNATSGPSREAGD